ncbi:MAG: tetratricopeptide repeat protein, partial [Okeania sp. SIO2D1]|nr:tetratricopeptide repeat protein [Okeania sp. SIO2D1]
MSKKKQKRHQIAKGFGANSQAVESAVRKVEKLLYEKKWEKAKSKLEELEERFPNHREVLREKVNFYYEIGDTRNYQHAAERLLSVEPNDKLAMLGLAGAYMANKHPFLALQAFKQFLERYPQDQQAEKVRETVARLEEQRDNLVKDIGLDGEDAYTLATWHEQASSQLEIGQIEEACQLEKQILAKRPDFFPALNNISLARWYEGNFTEAIEAAQQVLAKQADNFHALSNLTR